MTGTAQYDVAKVTMKELLKSVKDNPDMDMETALTIAYGARSLEADGYYIRQRATLELGRLIDELKPTPNQLAANGIGRILAKKAFDLYQMEKQSPGMFEKAMEKAMEEIEEPR